MKIQEIFEAKSFRSLILVSLVSVREERGLEAGDPGKGLTRIVRKTRKLSQNEPKGRLRGSKDSLTWWEIQVARF